MKLSCPRSGGLSAFSAIFIPALLTLLMLFRPDAAAQSQPQPPPLSPDRAKAPIALVVHGGAGTIRRGDVSPAQEEEYRTALRAALAAGYAVLESGGTSLDAVTIAVRILEDEPLFNAGRGAVLNAEGLCELDASIMDGRTLAAGAVAGVRHVRNPILLARAVMAGSPHVLLAGAGAETFAKERGLELMPDEYFITEPRRQELQRVQKAAAAAPGTPAPAAASPAAAASPQGTVGAVALDRHGHLAAATSTGGMTNKRFGRIGDSPIIGAGNYANDATCAVSATGHGEFFIRSVVAYDVSALMEYRGWSLEKAAAEAIRKVGALGGTGGLIAVDRAGNVALPFNTAGMYRAYRQSSNAGSGNSEPVVEIFAPAAAAGSAPP